MLDDVTSKMEYFKNSSWMIFEYIVKIISVFFVTIYIARYLGPESFGLLTYALAILSIFMVLSRLGMESILVREVSKSKEKTSLILGQHG